MKNHRNRKGRKENARKRDAILEAALEVFAQKGFLDATISEIAKKASVAEATIYEYFENKENLLFSTPGKKQKEALDLLAFQLAGVKGALNKIRKFIWFYLWFFQNNRSWSSVALMILRPNKKFLNTPAYQLLRLWTQEILEIFKEGQEEGSIRKDINIFVARNLFLGTIEHLTSRWILMDKPKDLTEFANDTADLIVNAVKNPSRQEVYFINSAIYLTEKGAGTGEEEMERAKQANRQARIAGTKDT
jgi:TetR/AcrR family fatty acid metabolism transcriptional regulator